MIIIKFEVLWSAATVIHSQNKTHTYKTYMISTFESGQLLENVYFTVAANWRYTTKTTKHRQFLIADNNT